MTVPGRCRRAQRSAVLVVALSLAACGSTPVRPATAPPPSPTSAVLVPARTRDPVTSDPSDAPPVGAGPGAGDALTVQPQPAPGSCHYTYVASFPLPDPSCTPGAIDPRVTQANIDSTICRAGWTEAVRPPESVTAPEKEASALAYGYTGSFATAEYDHLVPLELGGDPNDPANLWVEPNDRPGATTVYNTKDELEDALNSLVCSGRLPLATARKAIATNWVAAMHEYLT